MVLTFDAQIGFADLLVQRYDQLWPSHPFEFLIPYQDAGGVPTSLNDNPRCRLVRAAGDIRSSMTALLDGVEDGDWVFWAIDDRYPIQVCEPDRLDQVTRAVMANEAPDIGAVRLLRWKENLSTETVVLGGVEFRLQQPGDTRGFWIHQFVRAGVLREVFLNEDLPMVYSIRVLHAAYRARGRPRMSERILVPSQSLLYFAEPCTSGKLISAARDDLMAAGCMPPDYEVMIGSKLFNDQRRGWP